MKQHLLTAIKVLFFLGIGILLIWLVVKDLDEKQREDIFQAFRDANYWWLIPSALIAFASHYSRAVRWNMMLRPMGYNPSSVNSFLAVMIGYLANLAVPRLGEVTRCGILNRYEKIPIYKSVGTVVTERAIDLIVLFSLFVIVFVTQFDTLGAYANEIIISPLKQKIMGLMDDGIKLLIAGSIGLLFVFIIYKFRNKIKEITILKRIFEMLRGFAEGLKAVSQVERPLVFVAHSIFIWVGYLFMVYFCFFCLEATSGLGLNAALSLVAFGSLAMIATPGGIGAYPVVMMAILTLYKVDDNMGFAFGWIAWTGQTLLVLVVGFISLAILPFLNKPADEQK